MEKRGLRSLELRFDALEIAKGHDGFLRGAPEPALIVAVYRVQRGHARLFGRYLYRFDVPRSFPAKVEPMKESRERLIVPCGEDSRLLLLMLAVEEDNGRGVASMFAKVERGDAVVVWTDEDVVPVPAHLYELGSTVPADLPQRTHVMFGEQDPSHTLAGDDWIDAGFVTTTPGFGTRGYRFHFVSGCGRNDWTAEFRLKIQGA